MRKWHGVFQRNKCQSRDKSGLSLHFTIQPVTTWCPLVAAWCFCGVFVVHAWCFCGVFVGAAGGKCVRGPIRRTTFRAVSKIFLRENANTLVYVFADRKTSSSAQERVPAGWSRLGGSWQRQAELLRKQIRSCTQKWTPRTNKRFGNAFTAIYRATVIWKESRIFAYCLLAAGLGAAIGAHCGPRSSPIQSVSAASYAPAGIETSFAPVVDRALPAVVNIASSKTTKASEAMPSQMDPFFRQFFGQQFGGDDQQFFGGNENSGELEQRYSAGQQRFKLCRAIAPSIASDQA